MSQIEIVEEHIIGDGVRDVVKLVKKFRGGRRTLLTSLGEVISRYGR